MLDTKKISKESEKSSETPRNEVSDIQKNKSVSQEPQSSKKEQLETILGGLKNTGGVKGSAVISRDGLVIASDLSDNVDADTFAAMSAAMQGAAETAIQELKQGGLNQIIIDSSKGKLISIGAGENAILVILAESDVNLGLVLLSLGKASGKISSILSR